MHLRLAFCFTMVLSFASQAADLDIRIFDRVGKTPLQGAGVCLGTSANVKQFGALRSNSAGYVTFKDVPQAPLVVTVSGRGYMGERQPLIMSNTKRLLVMSLGAGGGGPRCRLFKDHPGAGPDDFRVNGFSLNAGNRETKRREIALVHHTDSRPTHYRASESADLSNIDWEEYSLKPVFTLTPGEGRKTVYFQIRRYFELGEAHLQTLSPVVQDSINLRLP